MAKKGTNLEIQHRIDKVARLIVNAATTSQIEQYCADNYGVKSRQVAVYIKRAREIVREDYQIDRKDFLASRLGILDRVIQESLKSGQHSNAIGAARLQAQLAQLIDKGK